MSVTRRTLGIAMGQEKHDRVDLAAVGRRLKSEFGVQADALPLPIESLLAQLASNERKRERENGNLAW
jgi:hypothetical protein